MNVSLILGMISIIFISAALMMALISRNNFSKYKDRLIPGMLRNLVRSYIRKGGIYNKAEFETVSEEVLFKLFRFTGAAVFFLNVIFLIILGSLGFKNRRNEVKRPMAGDPPIEVEIDTGDHGEKNLMLKVYPVEYTDEEFGKITDAALVYAETAVKGSNPSLNEVREKLVFPEKDETGTIEFKWIPDRYDLIGSSGDIYMENLIKDEDVEIRLQMTDGIHIREESIFVKVLSSETKNESNNPILEELMQIEQEFRNSDTVHFPERIYGKNIRINKHKNMRNILTVLFIVPVIAVLMVYHRINRLKEKSDKRQKELKDEYYSFVSRLSLMLGSGASMKDSMRLAAHGNSKLTEEVNFCINQINSGVSESAAYSDMAKRVSIPEYTRLAALISQNIEHGNSRILMLMDQEVKNAMNIKREHLRRSGEIASEKLLLPTALLLIIVIGLIMIPAFYGLN